MRNALSSDAQVIIMLCSHLGLPQRQSSSDMKPLTPREWDHLAKRIWQSNLKHPGALLDLDVAGIKEELAIPLAEAERLTALLSRGGQLAIELERLSQLGIWVLTRADELYPRRLRELVGPLAAPVLCGAGSFDVLDSGFLAIAGSRDADDRATAFTQALGARCGRERLTLVSGMARGVDSVGTEAALAVGGRALGFLADSLESVIRKRDIRTYIADEKLTLLTAQHPRAGFSVGAAFARNKYVYCLAQYGLVVSASADKGGTRGGAVEVLKAKWLPLFVRISDDMPEGNRLLLREGAIAFDECELESDTSLASILDEKAAAETGSTTQGPAIMERELGVMMASSTDLFPVVWPYIAQALTTAHTVDGVANALSLRAEQAHSWLERAVELGHATHRARRNEYELAQSAHELRQAQLL